MASKKINREFELIDEAQTSGAVADFYENEISAMSALDVEERFEKDFKNIINNRIRRV